MNTPRQHASNCRFARPTLEEPRPLWFAAEQQPWACERVEPTRTIEDTEICETCLYWRGRIERVTQH